MTMQQVVGRGQGDRSPQLLVQRNLDFTHNQDAPGAGLVQKRGKKFTLLFNAEGLSPAPTSRWGGRIAFAVTGNEAPALLTYLARRKSYHVRCLLDTQGIVQW